MTDRVRARKISGEQVFRVSFRDYLRPRGFAKIPEIRPVAPRSVREQDRRRG